MREGDRRAMVGYEGSDLRPDRDFDLYYSLSQDAVAVNLLSYKTTGEDGFFLLLVTPPIEAGETSVAKDVVLVLDTSGSMDGDKIQQARAAADYVLDHLNADDRFNIVGFNTFTKLYAGEPQPASQREDGRAFVRELETAGSTDINRALLEAVAGADPGRPMIVIFLTDGLPTAGETDPDRIVANVTGASAKSVRLFAFGVGYDVDTMLLDQLSSNLRGVSAYVKPEQSIDEEVSGFYSRVSTPVLVDVAPQFAGVAVEDLYPYPLPDLFAGNQLVVAGRYRRGGDASLELSGSVNGQPQRYSYRDLRFTDRGGNEFIPRLWAQRKIGYLLAQIRLHGAKDELVKEVVALSTRYGIITPYTSFLVQEPPQAAAQQPAPGAPRAVQTQVVEKAVVVGQPTAAPAAPAAPAPAQPPAPAAAEPTKAPEAEMLAPQERSGEGAVQRAQTEKELSAGDYAAGPAASGQVRQVGDKAFVLRSGMWIDTGFDPAVMKIEEIAFGSDRYFQLLETRPEIGPYLALGDRVTVVIDGQAYAIGAAGQAAAPASSLAGTPGTAQARETGGGAAPATPPVCSGPAGAVLLVLLGMAAPAWARRRRQG
jgi:Ca-activated chloride channel family protein